MLNATTVEMLRDSTSAAHAALEQSDLVLPATQDRGCYGRLIGAMLSFHRAIEAEFRRFGEDFERRGVFMRDRYKTGLLRRESEALKSPLVARPQLNFASAAHAAGGVYVMEGSTLGGTVIAKSLMKHQGLQSFYYGCYGKATAERWRSTCEQINGFARDGAETMAMIDGAHLTFATLHHHLTSTLRPAPGR